MKFKRLLALTMVGCMAVAATACAAPAATPAAPAAAPAQEEKVEAPAEPEELVPEEGAEIEFAYWDGSESDQAAWNAVLDGFEAAYPEVKLIRQTYPSGDFRSMLDTRIAANDWPDVIRYQYQMLGKFKGEDVMLDLTPYMSQEELDGFVPGYLAGCSYQGKVVALPHHTDNMLMYYNKRMFEDAGIRIPESIDDAYSWDEVMEIARTLKEKNDLPYGAAGIWENGYGYRYLPFIYMNGGSIMNEDQTEITMDTPEVREALQFYDDMRAEDLFVNTGFTAPMVANNLFVAEQVAIDFAGSWHARTIQESMPDNWGVTYMPQKDGRTGDDMGGNSLFCYQGTKYPKAAALLVKYITSEEAMKTFCEKGNFIPVRTSLLGQIEYENFPEVMLLANEEVAKLDPKMASDETSVVFQQLNTIFSEEMDPMVINRSASVDDVIAACQERMTEVLNEQ